MPRNTTTISNHTLAWGLSLIVHLAAAGVLLWATYAHRGSEKDLEQLVFVEPAPPPPPPAERAGKKGDLIHPEHPESREGLALPQTPLPSPTAKPAPTRRPTRSRSVSTPTPALAAAPELPAAGEARLQDGEESTPGGSTPGGASGGFPGGVAGGIEGGRLGGVLGGRGDEVVDAQTVAKPPGLLERALPEYPVEARVKRIEGQVLLRAIVGRDGNVEPTVEVLSSVPELDAAAIDALRKWRFTPGHDRDGNPVRVRIDVPMRFQLKQR